MTWPFLFIDILYLLNIFKHGDFPVRKPWNYHTVRMVTWPVQLAPCTLQRYGLSLAPSPLPCPSQPWRDRSFSKESALKTARFGFPKSSAACCCWFPSPGWWNWPLKKNCECVNTSMYVPLCPHHDVFMIRICYRVFRSYVSIVGL